MVDGSGVLSDAEGMRLQKAVREPGVACGQLSPWQIGDDYGCVRGSWLSLLTQMVDIGSLVSSR